MRLNLQKKKIGIIAAVSLSAMFTNVMASPCMPNAYDVPYSINSGCAQDFYNKGIISYNELNPDAYNNGGVSGNGCNRYEQSDKSRFPPYSQEVEYVNNNTGNTPLCDPKLSNTVSTTHKGFTNTAVVIDRYKNACNPFTLSDNDNLGKKDIYDPCGAYGTGKNLRSQDNLQTGFVSACNDKSFQMKPRFNEETLGINSQGGTNPQGGTKNLGCVPFFNSPINTIPTNGNNNGGKVTPNYFQTPNQDSNGNFSEGGKFCDSRKRNRKRPNNQIDKSIFSNDSSEPCSLCAKKLNVPPPFIPSGMFTYVNETANTLIAFHDPENCDRSPSPKFNVVCGEQN